MKNNFYHSCDANINNQILDKLKDQEVISVSLSIKASHSGKVNGNYVFYTPKGMRSGINTLTYPFKKHLQNLHRGDAVGEINNATYLDYSESFSEDFQKIAERIESATTKEELVIAVKELTKHEDYKKNSYKGLGVVQVSAELYDVPLIKDLVSGTNKGKVSIGGNSDEVYCSICSSVFGKDHEHQRGMTYDDEVCFAIYNTMKLDHIGFVPEPADGSTETLIISDSLNNNSSSVTINEFKIQDNIQGYAMNIAQLKDFVKNADNVVNIAGLSDTQKQGLKDTYLDDKKHLRSVNFLFSEEKLLPVSTKTTVALTLEAINKLEDGGEKSALLDLIQPHVDKFFTTEETADQFLKAFEVKAEEEVAKTSEEETTLPEEEVTTTEEETKNTDIDLETLIQTVVTKTLEDLNKATEAKQTEEKLAIQDSVEYGLIINRNRQLETDNTSLATVNEELTNKYKNSIISQILLTKGLDSTSEYKSILEGRSIEALQNTLDDVQFDKVSTKDTKTEETQSLTTDTKTEETESTEVEKVALQDSLTNVKTENNDTPTDADTLTQMKREGLAQFIKKQKEKTNKG